MEFQKKNFSSIYNQVSPEPYINSLSRYNYRQPDPIYKPLVDKVNTILHREGKCQVIDVGCSYGFNGRIIKHRLPYDKFLQANGNFSVGKVSVIGIDIAPNALSYALKNDCIDMGVCQNLEKETLSLKYYELFRNTDLVVASGAFSYVGLPTFQQIYGIADIRADFVGWPACSYNNKDLLNFLSSNFHEVRVHPSLLPIREFTDQQERDSFHSAMKSHNPEFYGHFNDHFCVFQLTASGKK